jgi:dextranase
MKFRNLGNLIVSAIFFYSIILSAQTQITALNNNKALYNPADTVFTEMTFSASVSSAELAVEYYHLNEIVFADTIPSIIGNNFKIYWNPPLKDFTGYLLKITLIENGTPADTGNIAIDVSSNWKRFPRYGFLSKYPILSTNDAELIIKNLNRHHINGIQFYDWHWKHHKPLKGEPGNVSSSWLDIANKTVYLSTLQKYFDACNERGINKMAYNLLYGAYSDAANDGVSNEWRIFKDAGHQFPDFHDLPSNWASDIYLIDHSNNNWVSYINFEMQKVFQALDFTGWHIDQLGDRGTRYRYNGQVINMAGAIEPFIDTAKNFLQVPLIFNAVTNYGQNYIAKTDVDFLYTEVWSPYDRYTDLASLIFFNNNFSSNTKNSVLAAYVNKGLGASSGFFNTPSVLFTDAVIFASGGSHLELGEHMLNNEYFPNNNLAMSPQLKSSLIRYYDFLTAYENILRDSLQSTALSIFSDSFSVATWPPQQGKLWVFPRKKNNLVVLNVINFTQATTMNWRDDTGIQAEPDLLENIHLVIPLFNKIQNVWYASPDNQLIVPENIAYTTSDSNITVTLPKLKYWSTIVLEFEDDLTDLMDFPNEIEKSYFLEQNYPNPFNPKTNIQFRIPEKGHVSLKIFDLLGNVVADLVDEERAAGNYTVPFDASSLSSGIYFYRLLSSTIGETKKMILLR